MSDQYNQQNSMPTESDMIMDWDSPIEQDDQFVVLPEGEYQFTVIDMERGTYKGSEKTPQCPQATLTLQVDYNGQPTRLKDNLILYRSMEWKISQFFRSIGLKKHKERLVPQWNNVVGRSGRLKITKRKYTSNKDGNEYEANNITYLDPPLDTALNYPTQSQYASQQQAQAQQQVQGSMPSQQMPQQMPQQQYAQQPMPQGQPQYPPQQMPQQQYDPAANQFAQGGTTMQGGGLPF